MVAFGGGSREEPDKLPDRRMGFRGHTRKLTPGPGQVLDTAASLCRLPAGRPRGFRMAGKVELRSIRPFRYFAFQGGDRAFERLADQPAVRLRQGIETV